MTTKNAYRLINPYMEGSIDTVIRARNSFSAGKKIYNTISNYFTNHLDDFYMTIQNVETKELSHFKIGEKRSNDKSMVDYTIIKMDKQFPNELENKLIDNIAKLEKQQGGKHKNEDDSSSSSSSSSDSDSDHWNIPVQPVSKFIYFYLPYYKLHAYGITPLDAARIFLPTFGLAVNPSMEIRFDLYKYF